MWCLAYVIRIAWCARWRIYSFFFFDAIQTTNALPCHHDNETQSPPSRFPAPSITSFHFALRNAQIVQSSATNNGCLSSSPECARLESPFCLSQSDVLVWEHLQDVFADNLRELQAHVCLVDHKYVVRISKDKVVSRDTEVVDPLCWMSSSLKEPAHSYD